LTVILDPEDYLAALYHFVSADGTVALGHSPSTAPPVVRQAQVFAATSLLI